MINNPNFVTPENGEGWFCSETEGVSIINPAVFDKSIKVPSVPPNAVFTPDDENQEKK